MSNIPRVPLKKRLFSASNDSSKKHFLLIPEHKSLRWMMDLMAKFCKAEGLVLDTGANTLPTAIACWQLFGHRCSVLCEMVSTFLQKTLLSLVKVYVKQVLRSPTYLGAR